MPQFWKDRFCPFCTIKGLDSPVTTISSDQIDKTSVEILRSAQNNNLKLSMLPLAKRRGSVAGYGFAGPELNFLDLGDNNACGSRFKRFTENTFL